MNEASGPNPPSCMAVRTSSAIGQPSASRPAFRRATPIARYVVPMKSSSRVHSRWIGMPRFAFAIMIACSAWGPLPLRPKPPPRWHRCRWTFCSGMPVIFAALKRVSCGL